MRRIIAVFVCLTFCGTTPSQSEPSVGQNTISVPLLYTEGGTYVVRSLINNSIVLDFIVDSGAADVSIPSDVVSVLFRTGR